jgi:HK97 family phage prohead protease
MTELAVLRQEAAAARAAAAGGKAQAFGIPTGNSQRDHIKFGSELRAQKIKKDGEDWYQVEGYASVFERGYDMWDEYGPYTEVVSKGAADKTLAANPLVIFRFNHGNTPMANTRNGRLELSVDDTGLHMRALLNPTRDDVRLLMQAIEDQDVTEQSFMFHIDGGTWSPDYTEYRIDQFDLERGDVGPVTYGANPHTSIAARSGEILAALRGLPSLARREALQILNERADLAAEIAASPVVDLTGEDDDEAAEVEPEAQRVEVKPLPKHDGRSVSMWRSILLADDQL